MIKKYKAGQLFTHNGKRYQIRKILSGTSCKRCCLYDIDKACFSIDQELSSACIGDPRYYIVELNQHKNENNAK